MSLIYPVLSSVDFTNIFSKQFIDYILHSNVLNNILVLIFILWVLKKADIINVLDKKKAAIIDSIDFAELEKNNSVSELNEAHIELKKVDTEVIKIKENSKTLANSLVSQIQENTQNDIKDIETKTERVLVTESSKAKDEVSATVANAALLVAHEHIRQSLDGDLHRKFIEEFIDSIDEIKV